MSDPKPRRRRLFPQTLKDAVYQATAPVMDGRHKTLALLIRDWEEIVGMDTARSLAPMRITFPQKSATGGTLYVRVPAYKAPELPYLTPALLEKITRYLGHAAITRILPEIKG